MTPEAVAEFRGFWHLGDLANSDDPEAIFNAMAALAAWSFRQAAKATSAHDAILSGLGNHTALRMGLLLHLGTIDRHFFNLSKRMAARTLVRHERPASIYRQMAAALLVSDAPKNSSPKAARDVALIIGITVGLELGWFATESEKAGPNTKSACGRMAAALGERFGLSIEYSAMVKVWNRREAILQAAGFDEKTVLEFLPTRFPMNVEPT